MAHIYSMAFQQQFLDRLRALPQRDTFVFPDDSVPPDHKMAAVLLPFWASGEDSVEVVFTRRPETMSSHAGQVSFPGGRVDADDESLAAAALREAEEELAIDPSLVTIMGRLDDAWSIAGHHVIPFVGWLEQRPHMEANEAEVAEVLVADVETLMKPETACLHEHVFRGVNRRTHAFNWDGGYVWGLTADILLEMLLWVKQEPSSRGPMRLENMNRMKGLAGPVVSNDV